MSKGSDRFLNGIKVSYSVPQSERLNKLQRYFSRAKKGSKNRVKEAGILGDVKGSIMSQFMP
ncbi:MAG: hypothetical protein GU362_05610 [Thaumarchaeota archaeon]|nr:hypothetical protein [Nitrososphaerota archaeon]